MGPKEKYFQNLIEKLYLFTSLQGYDDQFLFFGIQLVDRFLSK